MKKIALITTLIISLFVLTACGSGGGSGATNSTSSNGTSTNSFRNGSGATGPLNPESKLALGTIKLEGTKLAVDPKMAVNLIPLWQLLFQLNSSSSSAPQEVTAVVDQIQVTMTPEQIKTINSMQITQADIFTVFQQQVQSGTSGGANSTGGNRGNRGAGGGGGFVFAGGGGPGGGGPGGGGGFGGAFGGGGVRNNSGTGSSSTQANGAQTAAQAAQARDNALSNLVINQVIRLLETKLRS